LVEQIKHFETLVDKITAALKALDTKYEKLDTFLSILLAHVNFFRVNTGGRPYAGLSLSSPGISRFMYGQARAKKPTICEVIAYHCWEHHSSGLPWHEDLAALGPINTDFVFDFYSTILPSMCTVSEDLHRLQRSLLGTDLSGSAYPSLITDANNKLETLLRHLEAELPPIATRLATKYGINTESLSCFKDWSSVDHTTTIRDTVTRLRDSQLFRDPQQVLGIFEVLNVFSELRALWVQGYQKAIARRARREKKKAQAAIQASLPEMIKQGQEYVARAREEETQVEMERYARDEALDQESNRLLQERLKARSAAVLSVSQRRRQLLRAIPAEGKEVLQELAKEDGYSDSKASLEAKHAEGILSTDDLLEEMEQVLIECLIKKRKIVSRLMSGSAFEKDQINNY